MQQLLTTPDQLHTINVGRIKLSAQRCVDGGHTITIWPTADWRDAIRLTDADPRTSQHRYNVIAQMAATGMSPDELVNAIGSDRAHALGQVRDILDGALAYAAADDTNTSASAVRALQTEIEALETAAETAELDTLAADIRQHLTHGQCAADTDDPAGDYLTQVTTARHAAIDDAIRAADQQPNSDTTPFTPGDHVRYTAQVIRQPETRATWIVTAINVNGPGVVRLDPAPGNPLPGGREVYHDQLETAPRTLAACIGDPTRRNQPTLAAGTNRRLTPAMLDMLTDSVRNGGRVRLDTRAARNRARAIQKRGPYLTLIYVTPSVEASLHAADITDTGRAALDEATAGAVA